ncbi:MAG TPA: maleylpyruvate isomerase family mycothiol-dependent enzyme [Sporichthyaceae bacterium]|nr:maleylpyruvate isomerase family mycothiol-dependent enzyme [Sporichthyaceae bacterium]
MSLDRVGALATGHSANVTYLTQLSEADWATPSRCEGWTVKDVVSHMAAAYHGAFTPWFLKLMLGKDVEAANDRDVAKRQEWPTGKVLNEYASWGRRFRPMAGALQKPGLRSLPIKVAEVGVYPAAVLTSAFVFDHTLHVTYDIAAALGRPTAKPDANMVAVGIEWMMLGLPAMSGGKLSWLQAPLELNLVGPGGSVWTIEPGGKKGRVQTRQGSANSPVATIEGDAASFPLWGTGREPWRHAAVSIKGEEALGATFLDDARII